VVNIGRSRYDVYIGRAGKRQDGYFGNPFRVGRDGTREQVIEKFRAWFENRIVADPAYRKRVLALKGKRLGCFCSPLACHGQIIADWVNAQADENGS
jgi:hypothetical protein